MTKFIVLPVPFETPAGAQIIHPVIVSNEKYVVLVDTGLPGQLPLLEKLADERGVSLHRLTHVVITHHDMDHVGSLAALKRAYPSVQILSSSVEAEYISGKKVSPRIEMALQRLNSMLSSDQQATLEYIEMLKSVEKVDVDKTFKEDELLACFGGVLIISTPGHLPGHISLYFEQDKVLIAGDALSVENGQLTKPNAYYTLNMDQALESARKFLKYDIQQVICYHGGIFEGDVKNALSKIVMA
ncbi:MAG: MBL fold metallo-hydrolase [Microbacter sp.]